MNNTLLLSLLLWCCAAIPLYSQNQNATEDDSVSAGDAVQTLIPSGEYESGGFGALVVKAGPFNNTTGIAMGGRGGWVLNRTFVIGGGGYGFTDGIHFNQPSADTGTAFGYGGLEFEYLINSNRLLHFTVMTLIGAGGFSVYRRDYIGSVENRTNHLYSAACFVFEPAGNIEVNILRWLHLQLGVGYRFVTGIDAIVGNTHYTNSSASGFFGQGTIKFGPY